MHLEGSPFLARKKTIKITPPALSRFPPNGSVDRTPVRPRRLKIPTPQDAHPLAATPGSKPARFPLISVFRLNEMYVLIRATEVSKENKIVNIKPVVPVLR